MFKPTNVAVITLPFRSLITMIKQAILLTVTVYPSFTYAAPEGGIVTGGAGTISQSGLTTTIQQNSQNMAIEWNNYNLNSSERVQYLQPNQSSISLNHILSNSASTIRGRIDANGQVILVNPNGIFFTPESVINVGGIIASALDIKTSDFMNRDYLFNEVSAGTGSSDGVVINRGTINAALGGNVALLGKRVENSGLIAASLGSVALAAGRQAVLSFDDAGLLGVRVSEAVLQDELGIDPAVLNSGTIQAQAGQVLLTGSVSQNVFSQAVNSGGIEQARSVVVNSDGSFTLGDGADAINSGSVDVSNVNGTGVTTGGRIAVLGENVTSSGALKADASHGDGGEIELHSNNTTRLTGNSDITARSSSDGRGGTVKLLGERVGLFDNSQVDASGDRGGGTVLVGGDYQGSNPIIKNANYTFVGQDANINADALTNGDGGRVIVWANNSTQFYGNIAARGGHEQGDGGFAEVSGKEGLVFKGVANLTAEHGKRGLLLLDPKNITISSGSSDDSLPRDYDEFADNPSKSTTLNNRILANQLALSSVQLRANNDINITANITRAETTSTTEPLDGGALTLHAGHSITMAADVAIELDGTDFLAVINHSSANEGNRDSGKAAFTMNSGSSIKTNGGNISITTGSKEKIGNFTLQTLNSSGVAGVGIGAGGNAGNITLINSAGSTDGDNANQGNIILNAPVTAQGGAGGIGANGGNGGQITITANNSSISGTSKENITVNASALISASGGQGGVGISNGGDAGAIALTADKTVTLGSNIEAKGGSGQGGGVTGNSNAIVLDANTITTVGAREVNASGSSGTTTGNITFTRNSTSVNTLNLGGDLTLVAGKGGNVNLRSNIDYNGIATGTGTLTLRAGNDINVYGNIVDSNTGSADGLNITLNANSDNSVGGNVTIHKYNNADTTLNTGGGEFNVTGVDYIADSTSNKSVLINTGAGMATLNISGSATLGRMQVAGLSVTTAGKDGNNVSIKQGSVNANDTLTVTGAASFTSTASDGKIALSNSNNLQGDINLSSSGGYQGDVTLNNSAAITTLNNVTVAGNLTVNANRHLTVKGSVIGKGSDGLTSTPVTTTLALNFGQGGSNSTFTADGAIAAGNSIGNDIVNITLQGGTGNDTFALNSSGTLTPLNSGTLTLNGVGGNDTFNIHTAIAGSVNGGDGDDIFNLKTAGLSITSINGNGGNNTLSGAAENTEWLISGSDAGVLTTTGNKSVHFSGIQNLTGGDFADSFTLGSAGVVTGTLNGGGGANRLTARNSDNVWTVATLGSISSVNNAINFTNIQTLNGGTGNDAFTLTAAFAGEIHGNGGNNTLQATNSPNIWAIGTVNQLNSVLTFSDIQTVTGGTGVDTFTITSDFAGTLNGMGGDDQFTLSGLPLPSPYRGILNGGDGNDTFNIAASITGLLNGGAGDDSFTLNALGLAIADLSGGGGNDTLRSENEIASWLISGSDAGKITTTGSNTVNFSGIKNLIGGNSNDTFTLGDAGTISGTLDGGAGSNSLTGRATGNQSWTISTGNSSATYINHFLNIQTLNSGTGDDTFTLSSDYSGTLNGGAGNDTFTLSSLIPSYSGTLNGEAGNDIFNIGTTVTGILNGGIGADTFNINAAGLTIANIIGGDGIDTLRGNNATATWTVNAVDSGMITSTASDNISYSGVENLTGGSGDDTFTLGTAGTVTGILDGGSGNNRLNARSSGNNLWTLADSSSVTHVAQFKNIQTFNGGTGIDTFNINSDITGTLNGAEGDDLFTIAATVTGTLDGGAGNDTFNLNTPNLTATTLIGGDGIDTLRGTSSSATWLISGIDSGTLANINFTGIENLTGGSGDDSFTLGAAGAVSGTLDGGAGNNTLNSRVAENNRWLIAANDSSVSHVAAFRNLQILNGGSASDTFTISSDISGAINGGAGDDTFNISTSLTGALNGAGGADSFNINSDDLNINSIDGGDGSDTLRGANETSRWEITHANGGTLITSLDGSGLTLKEIRFTGIARLTGGSADDTFILHSPTNLTTLQITGGGNTPIGDSVDLSRVSGALRIALGSSGISNIENIKGNSDNGTLLIGENLDNNWLISGQNSGAVGRVQFTGITHLQGGSANDSFIFSDTLTVPFGGNIDGGEGRDTINYSNQKNVIVTVSDAFNAGSGSGISNIEGVVGGAGSTLQGTPYDTLWTIDGSGGTVKYQTIGSTPQQITLFFNGFTTLASGAGNDTLNINFSGAMNGALQFNGGAGHDTVNLSGGGSGYVGTYNSNSAQGEFIFSNGANRYSVAISNTETIRDDVIATLNLNGSAANDTIVLNTGLFSVNSATPVNYSNKQSITVDGAAGEDIITLQGDINATTAITLSAETVSNSTTATSVPTLTTDTLTLSAVNNAGTADNRLRIDTKNLQLTQSGTTWLNNRGDLDISQMSATGTTNIIASGNITGSAALTSDNSLTLETATGNINLNNSSNALHGPIALNATAGDITFNSGSNTELANISAKNLTLNIAGDINSNGTINVTGNSQFTASNNITLTGSNDFNTITLSGNNLLLHDNNTLNITRINARGSATLKASNNINVGNITTPQVTLNSSSGQIIDNNGSALNISADKIVLRANSGIGVGIGANEGLETEAAILDIINQTGNINISNRGNVQINNLVTQGDITLKNQQSVTVDTIDAGYESGKVEIEITNGSLYGYSFIPNSVASQRNYKTVPDITANIASIKTTGDVGTQYEPVSVNINREFALLSNVGSVYYYGGKPNKIFDDSTIKITVFNDLVGLSGQQLITVEALADIDPAIFTNIKNFSYNDIAVMLPRDQSYNDDEEEEEEETGG